MHDVFKVVSSKFLEICGINKVSITNVLPQLKIKEEHSLLAVGTWNWKDKAN